ncbi:8414_t:CDS:2, partial [Racocetra persica]
NQEKGGSGVIALNPGVHTFMIGYDPSEMAVEWGKNDIGNKHTRYRLRRVMLCIHKRIHCLVHECHRKLVIWLCENYHVIILPEFCTQRVIRRGQRRIGSKTARAMCTWSHFRFRQHLAHKAREHPWCASKVFRCPKCKTVLDRDINGARIFFFATLLKMSQFKLTWEPTPLQDLYYLI